MIRTILTAGVVLWGLAPRGAPVAGVARTHVVEIRGFEYSPSHLELAVGDTVVWINRDVVPHTATDSAGGWDSGRIANSGKWHWVAESEGRLRYLCTYHPSMRATLVVRGEP